MAKEGRTEAGLKVESDFLTKLWEEANIVVWSDDERKKAKRQKSEQRALPEAPRKSVKEAMKGFDGLFGNFWKANVGDPIRLGIFDCFF